MFSTIRQWFLDSETIVKERLTALVGLVTAAVGAMDWSPLLNLNIDTGFSKTQVMYLGAITFISGITGEVARRARDPFLTVTTAVAEQPVVAAAKKQVKKTLKKAP